MIGNGDDSVGYNTNGITTLFGGILHINGGDMMQITDSLSQTFQSFPGNLILINIMDHAFLYLVRAR